MRLISGSPGVSIGETDGRYLRLAGGTLTGNVTAQGRLTIEAPTGAIPSGGDDPTPGLPITHTWSSAGKTWTAIQAVVTDTASATASKLIDLIVGTASKFSVRKDGAVSLGSASNDPIIMPAGGGCGFNRRDISTANPFFFIGYYNHYLASIVSGGLFGWSSNASNVTGSYSVPDTALARNAAGVVEVNSGVPGTLRDFKCRRASLTESLDVVEMTAPAAPAANTCRLYVEDNGAGKTRLMALFPTGAAQQIAIEP